MQSIFYIASKTAWDRAQALALAKEHIRAGYRVRVLDAVYHAEPAEDGVTCVNPPFFTHLAWVRALWTACFFAVQRRGVVHVFGVQNGFVSALIRTLHPSSRIILHVDDMNEHEIGWMTGISKMIAIRLAHLRVASRKDLLRHEAFAEYPVSYVPYAIATRAQVLDTTVLRAHGLELQQYFLAYVHPRSWKDLEQLVKHWRTHVRSQMPSIKLAIVFTEDIPGAHIAFGHDVVILGHLAPYVERMLSAGARAILTPNLFAYRFEIITTMALGKYAAPIQELVNQNPFALEELADMYQEKDHALTDLADPALTMSWGHVARALIADEHGPEKITQVYEDLYGELFFAQSATASARTL